MTILLLGGAGLLGTAIRRHWPGYVILSPGEAELDLLDGAAVERFIDAASPDWIVNCAAYNNVDGAESTGRDLAYRLNADVPGQLAKLAAQKGIPLLHFSTDYVFAGDAAEPYTEDALPNPQSVYADAKRKGEEAVLANHPGAYLVRTSRLYGPKPDLATAKRSFVELILDDAQKAARVLVNHGERSAPTLVDDLAKHLLTHIVEGKPAPGIYHMTNSGSATWFEWASEIGTQLNLPVAFAPRDPASLKRPAARPAFSALTSTKLPPMRPWQEALREFIRTQGLAFQPTWHAVGIQGASVEFGPRIGEQDGAVLHLLPGGTKNAHGFGPDLLDLYAFTAKGKFTFRGGHYHLKLDELFFQLSGCALWILSDFRPDSPTFQKTVGFLVSMDAIPPHILDRASQNGIKAFSVNDGSLPRLRVPAGVYHAIIPLTEERMTTTAVASTPYDMEDYRYPALEEVPGAQALIETFRET